MAPFNSATEEAIEIFNNLSEKGQDFAIRFLKDLSEMQEIERNERNEAYLLKIRRGIKQCAEGRGLAHDIVEVADDE